MKKSVMLERQQQALENKRDVFDIYEIQSWREQPLTQFLLESLDFAYEVAKEEWANGVYQSDSPAASSQKTSEVLGGVKSLRDIIEYIRNDLDKEHNL